MAHGTGLHHLGVRVTDLERSIAFYAALGARMLAPPTVIDEEATSRTMTAPPGTRMRICLLGFPDGSGIELFTFGDVRPGWLGPPDPEPRLPHVGIQVDDVDAALARAEAAGGARLWAEPATWGPVRVMYLHDPDKNVLELLDAPFAAVAGVITGVR